MDKIIISILTLLSGILIGWGLRDIKGFTAEMPEYDQPPKYKTSTACRDVWDKIQGDSRWVLRKHCEEILIDLTPPKRR